MLRLKRTALWMVLASLVVALSPGAAQAQARLLRLQVWRVDKAGTRHPASGASVSVLGYGNPARTEAQGKAELFLPSTLQPGEPLSLYVSLEGYQLWLPTEGRTVVPKDSDTEPLEVVLLKLGSKLFLSDEAIEQLITDAARRAKEQVRPEGRPSEINLSRYIQEWARRHGFTSVQVQGEVERWAKQVEQRREDSRKLALAAFVRKDFAQAARYAAESAEDKLRKLEEVRQRRRQLEQEAVRDLVLQAQAHAAQGNYGQVLATYEQALRYVSREEEVKAWAALEAERGRAHLELGRQAKAEASGWHLEQAVQALEGVLAARPEGDSAEVWSKAQDFLQQARQLLQALTPPGRSEPGAPRGAAESGGAGAGSTHGVPSRE